MLTGLTLTEVRIDFAAEIANKAKHTHLSNLQYELHVLLEQYINGKCSFDVSLLEDLLGQKVTFNDFLAFSNQGLSGIWWALAGVGCNKNAGWELFLQLYANKDNFSFKKALGIEKSSPNDELKVQHFLIAPNSGPYQGASGHWFAKEAAALHQNASALAWIIARFEPSYWEQMIQFHESHTAQFNQQLTALQENLTRMHLKVSEDGVPVLYPTLTPQFKAEVEMHGETADEKGMPPSVVLLNKHK